MSAGSDPLKASGVALDTDALLRLRHLAAHIPQRQFTPTGMPGGSVTRKRGRGLETNDVRIFSYGDDIRHVDHNTTARSGVTHVRTFHDERENTAILIADFRPSMFWGTRRVLRSVAAAEALSILGWRANDAGDRTGLIAFTANSPTVIAARRRERGMASVIGGMVHAHSSALQALSQKPDQNEPPLDKVLEMAACIVPNGGSVVLASGLDNPGKSFDALSVELARRIELTILVITDAFESETPAGFYRFVTPDGQMNWALCRQNKTHDAVRERRKHLKSLGINTIHICAAAPPEKMAEELDVLDV